MPAPLNWPATDFPQALSAWPRNKICAVLGDSITAAAFQVTVPPAAVFNNYYNVGYASWIRFLSEQRVTIGQAQNFGFPGDTILQVSARVAAVIAQQPDFCIIECGTNDLTQQTPIATMKSQYLNLILRPLVQAGIVCFVTTICPKGSITIPAGGLQVMNEFNAWLRSLCMGSKLVYQWSIGQYKPSVVLCDVTPYWCNFADANGNPNANFLYDNIHPTCQGAYYLGKTYWNKISPYLDPVDYDWPHPQDYFIATNPRGNLLHTGTVNNGVMLGTTGTKTASAGFTFGSGNLATNFIVQRDAGNSTTVCDLTKEPLTETVAGAEQQRMVLTGSTAGLALEAVVFRAGQVSIGGAADIQPGDIIQTGVRIKINSVPTGLLAVTMSSRESGGAAAQEFLDMNTGNSFLFPQQAAEYPIVGRMLTEPQLIMSDSTAYLWKITQYFNATGVNPASDITIGCPWVRKFPLI